MGVGVRLIHSKKNKENVRIFGVVNRRIFLWLLGWWGMVLACEAQRPSWTLRPDFHSGRREAVRHGLPKGAVAVFFSTHTSKEHPYLPEGMDADPNFFYLTGYRGVNAAVLIFKEKQRIGGRYLRDVLLLPSPPTADIERFEGRLWRPQEAHKALGIASLYWRSFRMDWGAITSAWALPVRPTPWLDSVYNGSIHSIAPTIARLREVKTKEELRLIKRAIFITTEAQREAITALSTQSSERTLAGIHRFVYAQYNAEGVGFSPIIAAGKHACTLHHRHLSPSPIQSGCVVMDTGAKVGGYTADITRTVPVGTHFSKEEKQLYALLLSAQQKVLSLCKSGQAWQANTRIANDVIQTGLEQLGILSDDESPIRYLPHGVTHTIGLEVHDPLVSDTLRTGMVITIEPGVYIPPESPCSRRWWGIGMRLEDDVLVQREGCVLLSHELPREAKALEALRQGKKSLLHNYPPTCTK